MARGGHFFNRRNVTIIFGVLAVIFLALSVNVTFFEARSCETFECFQDAMRDCKNVKFHNDDAEATWRYEILGVEGGRCAVEVTLLQPKVGDLKFAALSGFGMTCNFPKGIAVYPEKDLERCHGRLKEELQTIIIRELHSYILENIGEIGEGLRTFGEG